MGLFWACWRYTNENFFFFTFFHLKFAKIYGPKKMQNYTPDAVGHGGRKARSTVAPPTAVGHGGRGPVSFKKIVIFCLNSDEGNFI
jgi:hypothetical protein